MKKKIPEKLKDGFVGMGIGMAIIIPGISAATIALISGAYEKIIKAAKSLFTKNFFRNFLILLPFLLGAIVSLIILVIPFKLAFEHCLFSIITLFAGFILASIPGLHDEVRGQKTTPKNIIQIIIGFAVAVTIGVLSILSNLSSIVEVLFEEVPFYLYFIMVGVGLIGSIGLAVPGFSGSLLMILIGFYNPILNLISFTNFLENMGLLLSFAVGLLIGVMIISKIMDPLLTKHTKSTIFVVIGFVLGSLISIYGNSQVINYVLSDKFGLLDWILAPILFVVGFVISALFTKFKRKHSEKNA